MDDLAIGNKTEHSFVLTAATQERVWQSVLRIRENPAGDEDAIAATATALVFDVDSQTLYVLASLHFIAGFYDHCSTQFQQKINAYEQENDIKSKDRVRYAGDLVQLVQVGRDAAEYEVTTVKIDPSVCWKASCKQDFGIFKIPLDASWDCSIRGQAARLEVPPLETPSTRSNLKRKAAELAQPSRPLAVQLCKTPSFRFDVQATETVHMFGFSAAAGCRYVASTTVSAVRRNDILLQSPSLEGLFGGAVIATPTGQVVGVLGGSFSRDDPKVPPFACFAYKVDKFPAQLKKHKQKKKGFEAFRGVFAPGSVLNFSGYHTNVEIE